MRWPTPDEFNEAVQNPQFAFADSELATGRAVVGPFGIPLPYSGAFADVYQFECGRRTVAVKCFTRPVEGLEMRYAAIADRLKKVRLGFTVGFEYLPHGIRHNDAWYPAVKMDWVAGVRLNEFIAGIVEKPKLLSGLIRILAKIGDELDRAEVGHGDLQHGNVLLIPAKAGTRVALRLVDYDGMWVPALANDPPGEVGHPDYQHPGRAKEGYYGPFADRFSLLAVAAAIRCLLAGGMELWRKYDSGTNVLFRESDFHNPHRSELFAELLRTTDPVAMRLVAAVAEGAVGPIRNVPRLNEVMAQRRPVVLPAFAVPWLFESTGGPSIDSDNEGTAKTQPRTDEPFDTRPTTPETRPHSSRRRRVLRRSGTSVVTSKLWARRIALGLTCGMGLLGALLMIWTFRSPLPPVTNSPLPESAKREVKNESLYDATHPLPSPPIALLPLGENAVIAGTSSEFSVRIKRLNFDGPVRVMLEGWPTAKEPITSTIPEGKDEIQLLLPAILDEEASPSVKASIQIATDQFSYRQAAIIQVKPRPAIIIAPVNFEPLQSGESRTLTVKVNRINCDGPISVRISDLPKHVSARDVIIPANENQIDIDLSAREDSAITTSFVLILAEQDRIRATKGFYLIVEEKKREITEVMTGIKTAETNGHLWHYTFVKPSNEWFKTNFKEGDNWKTGKSAFGFINSNVVYGLKGRIGTQWKSENIWLRTTVELPDSIQGARARWRFYYDDNIRIFVNGDELLSRTGYVTDYVEYIEKRTALKPRKNVIAVQCHNTGLPSGVDVGFVWEKMTSPKK